MKEQAIKKINKIGKISSVFALIAKILVGMALVVTLLAVILCFVIPEDLLEVTINADMTMEMDFSALGVTMTEEELIVAQAELEQELLTDQDDSFTDVTMTTDGVTMKGGLEQYSFTMRDMAWLIVLGFVALAMTFVTLIFIGGLCKAFRDCQSPFEDNVIKKMQHLAYSLIPWAIISTVTNTISETLANNKLSIMFSVDFGVILIALVVLVIVYIFKYGAVLQQESDETL